jgi:hypothetical protein
VTLQAGYTSINKPTEVSEKPKVDSKAEEITIYTQKDNAERCKETGGWKQNGLKRKTKENLEREFGGREDMKNKRERHIYMARGCEEDGFRQ